MRVQVFKNYQQPRMWGKEINVRRTFIFEKTLKNQNANISPIRIHEGKVNLER